MTDLVSTTITIPTDGYIVVRGRSNFKTSGTAGQNIAHMQIDESQGGGDLEDYQSAFGIDAHSNSGTHNFLFTVYTDRIYFKSAGSHTFRLEARPLEDNSEGAVSTFSNSFITATFFSTSYGSVNATAASGKTAAVRGSGSDSRVDLRDLELQAAHLRADAERAQRELLEAKLSRPDNR